MEGGWESAGGWGEGGGVGGAVGYRQNLTVCASCEINHGSDLILA